MPSNEIAYKIAQDCLTIKSRDLNFIIKMIWRNREHFNLGIIVFPFLLYGICRAHGVGLSMESTGKVSRVIDATLLGTDTADNIGSTVEKPNEAFN